MAFDPRPPSLPSVRSTPFGERSGGQGRINPTSRTNMITGSPSAAGTMTPDALGSAPIGSV